MLLVLMPSFPARRFSVLRSTPKARASLGASWESCLFSVILPESFYSKVSSLTTAPSACTCSGDITIPVKSAFITDLELGFKPTENLKVSFGANNLFNHYPTKTRQDVMDAYLATSSTSYATQVYPSISPFGINGGYYYARVNEIGRAH